MAKTDSSNKNPESTHQQLAEDVFSSEKREDIWAIIIAIAILILSLIFPDQIYYIFNKMLYLL